MRYGLTTITVNTIDELIEVIDRLDLRAPPVPFPSEGPRLGDVMRARSFAIDATKHAARASVPVVAVTANQREAFSRLYDRIESPAGSPSVRRLVQALARSAEPMSDVDLRNSMKIADNQQLGAAITALGKNARRAGIAPSDVLQRIRADGPGGAKYYYSLSDEMRAVVVERLAREVKEETTKQRPSAPRKKSRRSK